MFSNRVSVFQLVAAVLVVATLVLVSERASAQVVVYRPVVVASPYYVASPVIAADPCCEPVVMPTVAYYPTTVAYQQTARVVTRYRPILGGTVTRVRPGPVVPVVYSAPACCY